MLLAISHTVKPCGTVVSYPYGMPIPEVKCMGSIMKKAALNHVTNTARKGGAGYEDAMEELINEAHQILTVNSKRG